MWKTQLLLVGLFAVSGCESFETFTNGLSSAKVDNPVMGPPPPRIAGTERVSSAVDLTPRPYDDQQGKINLTGGLDTATTQTGDRLTGSQVVATVKGAPIFDSEVLEPYGLKLEEAAKKYPPDEFQQLREDLIKRDLQGHIDRKLLVESLRSTLKKEQLEMLDSQLNQMFEYELKKLKKEYQVNTRHEVELEMQKQGTSLEHLRNAFANQQMAREYLNSKSKEIPKVGRPDMLRYYDEHSDEYFVPGQVKWRQIAIRFDKHGGQSEALAVLEQTIDELRAGTGFGEVARKFSDGATSEKGGQWDWTRRGSLADQRIEKALFELPVGMISQFYVGENNYQLVKVVARREPRQIPFEQVQKDIKQKLEKEARRAATQKVLTELLANAVVWTMFDNRQTAESTPVSQ